MRCSMLIMITCAGGWCRVRTPWELERLADHPSGCGTTMALQVEAWAAGCRHYRKPQTCMRVAHFIRSCMPMGRLPSMGAPPTKPSSDSRACAAAAEGCECLLSTVAPHRWTLRQPGARILSEWLPSASIPPFETLQTLMPGQGCVQITGTSALQSPMPPAGTSAVKRVTRGSHKDH